MTMVGPRGDAAVEAASGHDAQRAVVVRVGAAAAYLAPLRAVAGDLATRADFDLDTVADLRLAVDEAAAELVGLATSGALLTGTFLAGEQGMEVTLSVPSAPERVLPDNTFGWRVLTTLVDEVRALHDQQDGMPVTGILLRKRRGEQAEVGAAGR
ncbi:MAG: ATP-binding protein [Pseudonocardiaceae bacterium]